MATGQPLQRDGDGYDPVVLPEAFIEATDRRRDQARAVLLVTRTYQKAADIAAQTPYCTKSIRKVCRRLAETGGLDTRRGETPPTGGHRPMLFRTSAACRTDRVTESLYVAADRRCTHVDPLCRGFRQNAVGAYLATDATGERCRYCGPRRLDTGPFDHDRALYHMWADRATVEYLYVERNHSIATTARLLGIGANRCIRRLDAFDIPRAPPGDSPEVSKAECEAFRARLDDGESPRAIAADFEWDSQTVTRHGRRNCAHGTGDGTDNCCPLCQQRAPSLAKHLPTCEERESVASQGWST
ncbi:hypothetical protein [Halomarina oriensis]|uniref:Uncharacterized protein n=1 Tax=Halomarina oriensis TaxID=671145 RepID=A0A6B0GPB0_9EURY|nr:hypothetical protein [Halomarina oriensis]MWG36540.1 hypothetical protein [Halomarina oriensis]